jgi:hypothetical protein
MTCRYQLDRMTRSSDSKALYKVVRSVPFRARTDAEVVERAKMQPDADGCDVAILFHQNWRFIWANWRRD